MKKISLGFNDQQNYESAATLIQEKAKLSMDQDESSKFRIDYNEKEAIRRSSGGKYVDLSGENNGTLIDIKADRALSPSIRSKKM